MRQAAMQAKMQAKHGTQASAIGTTGEAASVHDKTGTGMAIHKNNDKIREGRSIGVRQRGEARAACGQSIYSVDKASDSDPLTRSDAPQPNSQPEE